MFAYTALTIKLYKMLGVTSVELCLWHVRAPRRLTIFIFSVHFGATQSDNRPCVVAYISIVYSGTAQQLCSCCRCKSVFKILSLTCLAVHLLYIVHKRYHQTLNASLQYFVNISIEKSKTTKKQEAKALKAGLSSEPCSENERQICMYRKCYNHFKQLELHLKYKSITIDERCFLCMLLLFSPNW